MSTMTAQMLIGSAHPYDGGINPDYYMYLSENSVARWTLIEENISQKHINNGDQRIAQWIPTIEHMIEDALLMIGLYIIKDEDLINMIKSYFMGIIPRTAELYVDIPSEDLVKMRQRVRNLKLPYKVTISVFEGSTIMNQLQVLEEFTLDVEVCVPVYIREYNVWTKHQEIRGNLEKI